MFVAKGIDKFSFLICKMLCTEVTSYNGEQKNHAPHTIMGFDKLMQLMRLLFHMSHRAIHIKDPWCVVINVIVGLVHNE